MSDILRETILLWSLCFLGECLFTCPVANLISLGLINLILLIDIRADLRNLKVRVNTRNLKQSIASHFLMFLETIL